MKKRIISTMALVAVMGGSSVFAENTSSTPVPFSPEISTVSANREVAESFLGKTLEQLKLKANNLIKQRINSLESNKKAIDASKLTDTQKSSLGTIITTNINNLNILNTTISSSTDASSTRQLIKTIYTDYRIYGVIIPKVRLEKRIYDLQNHATKLNTEVFPKIQTRIDEQKAKGKDTTEWQKKLDEAKTLVSTDSTTLNTLFVKVDGLKPSDYGTTSKSIIESTNQELKKIAKDFNTIRKIANAPYLMMKKIHDNGGVGSATRR